jgi:uncharacterized membrane protein YfcA
MSAHEFTVIVFVVSIAAGFLGALTGLGGGIVVTPALTLFLGVDIRYAISLCAGWAFQHSHRHVP